LWQQVGSDYDLVGFDPRGSGQSEPRLQCFKSQSPGQEYTIKPFYSHATFMHNTVLDRGYDFPLNVSMDELRQILVPQQRVANAMQKTQHEFCRRSMDDEQVGDDLKYMGTTNVVRDMEAIVTGLDGENAPINFVGGSYGSILGQYLINMFPDRVGRVAIDGIVDPVSWTTEPSYRLNRQWLSSTEDTYNLFFSRCAKAGPEQCLLTKVPNEDPVAIRERLENFLNELYYSPVPVPGALSPTIFTAGQAWKRLFSALKDPDSWPWVARQMAQAMDGDATTLINGFDFRSWHFDMERSGAMCNDGPQFAPSTAEDIVDEYLDVFQNVSRFAFAAIASEQDPGCQYWPVVPRERFVGPWNHSLSNPILVISNTIDPIAPFTSAEFVAGSLGNSSRLLTLDGPGHSLATSSPCVVDYMKAYLANGTLPPEGTVCKLEYEPFPDPRNIIEDDDDEDWHPFNLHALNVRLYEARRKGYLGVTQ